MSENILQDNRFAKYLNDPRYKQIPKHERKVKIDKRFESMFNDEKFKVKYTVDKRGRPINETSTENLRRYYDLEESDEDSDAEEVESEAGSESCDQNQKHDIIDEESPGRFVKRISTKDDDNVKEISNESIKFKNDKLVRGNLDKKIKNRLLDLDIDYARGEGTYIYI